MASLIPWNQGVQRQADATNRQLEQQYQKDLAQILALNPQKEAYSTPVAAPPGATGGTPNDPEIKSSIEARAATQQQLAAEFEANSLAVQAERERLAALYGQRETELTQFLTGLGDSQKQQLERQRVAAQAKTQQDMLNRGMLSTSSYQSAARGVDQAFNQDLMALNEGLNRQQMDYRSALSGETLAATGAATEGKAKMAADVFQAKLLPTQTIGEYSNYLRDANIARISQDSAGSKAAYEFALGQQQIASQEAMFNAQIASNQRMKMQELSLQKLGLMQETSLGYSRMAADIKVASLQSSLERAKADMIYRSYAHGEAQSARNAAYGASPEGYMSTVAGRLAAGT